MAHDPTPGATKSWILAEYTEVHPSLAACRKARHTVDEALGWPPSRVPYIALVRYNPVLAAAPEATSPEHH